MKLSFNAHGALCLVLDDATVHEPVYAVRAFPVQDPDGLVALVAENGHEVLSIERLDACEPALRETLTQALQQRSFTPCITALLSVSGFATPCMWHVQTDRGPTSFVLKGEEDIRRLTSQVLLISDAHGVQYLLKNPQKLNRASRKLLDRFL